ncbi:MAG: hypothetical protein FJW83_08225 [Actinobacteria bacterium]|nr:hypothetical protein [Actinomycetota bacterium]
MSTVRGTGTVTAFDDPDGIGTLVVAGRVLRFHAAAVADSSRHVEVGAVVRFVERPGHHGVWEADSIEPT